MPASALSAIINWDTKHLAVTAAAYLLQSCPTLCNPIDCSLPGSSVHGILQARVLEWVALPSSRGSSQPRDQTQVYPHFRQILYQLSPQLCARGSSLRLGRHRERGRGGANPGGAGQGSAPGGGVLDKGIIYNFISLKNI